MRNSSRNLVFNHMNGDPSPCANALRGDAAISMVAPTRISRQEIIFYHIQHMRPSRSTTQDCTFIHRGATSKIKGQRSITVQTFALKAQIQGLVSFVKVRHGPSALLNFFTENLGPRRGYKNELALYGIIP